MKPVSAFFSRFFLFLFTYSLIVFDAFGVGAYPYPQEIRQPDGTELTIRLHGDEWFNWTSTIDGYRIVKTNTGIYEYASILKSGSTKPAGVKASDPDKRSGAEISYLSTLEKGPGVSNETIQNIRESYTSFHKSSIGSTYFAPVGQQKLLVILANFSDTQPSYTSETFDRFMNEPGYNGTGSFRDFYLENSGGRLDISSVVTQWVTLPNTHDYYGPQEKWGEFAFDAIKAAYAAGIDFSQFDNNEDGIVEGIAIIHQGPGQEVTGNESDIWSHSWTLSSAGYTSGFRRFNGVLVDRYTAQPETRNTTGAMNTIGVICHEFGHNLALPDYYDTNQAVDGNHDGTGRWDLMASGPYNGSPQGSLPAHHNPFSKIELGWVQETTISAVSSQILEPVMTSENVLRINSPVAHEYLLLENRRRTGFDQGLYGQGMLVYHVDEKRIAERRVSNTINASAHQGLYVLAAGGTINSISAPFPGSLSNTQLTDDSTPAMLTWTGEPFNRSITGISALGDNILFNFMAVQNGSPLTFDIETLSSSEVKLNWTPSLSRHPVLLAWSPDNIFGEPENGVTYSVGSSIPGGGSVLYFGIEDTLFMHSGLEASTQYYYRIWSEMDDSWSSFLSGQVMTDVESVSVFPWFDGFETGLHNWRQSFVTGSYSWDITSEGIQKKPNAPFEGDLYARFYVPSFTTNRTRLISPIFQLAAETDYVLSFRHIQIPWDGDQDKQKVFMNIVGSDDWTELAFYEDSEPEWIHRKIPIPHSGQVRIAFEGMGNYGYGIGLDNVSIFTESHCNLSGISNVLATSVTETGMILSWVPSEGESVLVVARKGAKVTELPVQGTSYTPGENFGNESFVVYSGDGAQVELTELDHSSEYYFTFFPYNESLCYAYEPAQYTFPTVIRIHTISFSVSSAGSPIHNAIISLGAETLTTNVNGIAETERNFSTVYSQLSVSAEGFKTFWNRLKPDRDLNLNINLAENVPAKPSPLFNYRNNKSVLLEWSPVIDEAFDGYDAFSLGLPGWTMIDSDGSPTYSIEDVNFPNQSYTGSFIVLDPMHPALLQANIDLTARSGRQLLAAFAAVSGPNNDWLISPTITVEEGDRFNFMARSLTDRYGLEQINVLISEQEPEITGFNPIQANVISVPTGWTQYSFLLNAYKGKKIKIAIQCVSDDAFALLLDDIRVVKTAPVVSGTPVLSPDFGHAKKSRPVAEVVKKNAQQFVNHSASQILSNRGSIGYTIEFNGEQVGKQYGFYQTGYPVEVEFCKGNTFRIRTDYLLYDNIQAWSDVKGIEACYIVTFSIVNYQGLPVENVMVEFDDQIRYTNSQGIVVFPNVYSPYLMSYTVVAQGYEPELNKSVLVTEDTEIEIVLMPKDSTLLRLSNANVHFYPNPISSALTIFGVSPGIVNIRVFDIGGRLIWQGTKEGGNEISIELNNAHPGVYVVELSRGSEIMHHKVFKQ